MRGCGPGEPPSGDHLVTGAWWACVCIDAQRATRRRSLSRWGRAAGEPPVSDLLVAGGGSGVCFLHEEGGH